METKLYTQEQLHSIAQSVASKICGNDVSIEYVIDTVKRFADSKIFINSEKIQPLIYAENVRKIVIDVELVLPTKHIQELRTRRLNNEILSENENFAIHEYLCVVDAEYLKAWTLVQKRLTHDGLDLIK